MRLTRRGWTVVAIGVGAFVLAIGFGSRALNGVVVPAIVALAAGYVQIHFLRDVTITRDTPGDDYVEQGGPVTLCFHDEDGDEVPRPFVATVRERVGEGIRILPPELTDDESPAEYTVGSDETGEYAAFETAVGQRDLEYHVEYETRGERTFGPVTLTARDVFGLVEVDIPVRGTDSVLVYPRIYRLNPRGRNPLRRLEEFGRSRQRDEFEELREYSPGDPLRDIHWKTAAKRDELIVKEFAAESEAETVTISAGAAPGNDDRMAEAVASLTVALVEEGIPVEVSTVEGTVEVGPKQGGMRRLLRTLALVPAGRTPDPEADVVIQGSDGRVVVRVAGTDYRFSDLVTGAEDPPSVGAGTAAQDTATDSSGDESGDGSSDDSMEVPA